MDIETIHDSLINGQRQQMVEQIQEYGLYDFWDDYNCFLNDIGYDYPNHLECFADAIISYHRITSR